MPSQRGGFRSFVLRAGDRSALPFVTAAVIVAVAVAAMGFVLLVEGTHPVLRERLSNLTTIMMASAIPVTSGRAAARSHGRTQLAWRLMTGAGVLWLLGELIWLLENYVFFSTTSPALSDFYYLLALLPAAGALLVFPPPLHGRGERIRLVLTALVVTGAVLFVSRSLVLSLIIPSPRESWLARAVDFAYPTTDIVLASLALIVLVRVGSTARVHLVLLAAGFLVYSVSDTRYIREAALDRYVAGSLLDLGWIAGYACFVLAPLAPHACVDAAAPNREVRLRPYDWSSMALYLPLLAAVVVAASDPPRRPDLFLIVTGLGTLVAFAFRQALLAGDHRRLRLDLESQVGQLRTRSAELRQLASENKGVIQSVVDGVFGVDVGGCLTFVNPSAVAMLGRSVDELVGSPVEHLFHGVGGNGTPTDGRTSPTSSAVSAALRHGTAISGARALLLRADGSVFPVELAVGPIRQGDDLVGAVVVFRDVSARLAVEKMKNEFVSVVSHELRTPLTSIRASLGLLHSGLGGALSERGSRMVSIALESSERLTRLIEDMLDLERMESGSLTMVLVDCEIGPLVATSLNEVDSMARKYGVRLRADLVEGLIRCDADRIVQTLTNLLGNSIKFSPRGGTVVLSVAQRRDQVEFAVADRGRGIPADRVGRIFERFEQVDSSDSRERGGTGLGLAISRDIIELHGGAIWVESELGDGSTFRFTVPGSLRPEGVVEPVDEGYRHDLDGAVT